MATHDLAASSRQHAAAVLRERIASRTAHVGIIGLGYVGLPLCGAFVRAGFRVTGFDIDPEKIVSLMAGRSYLKHVGESLPREMLATGRFAATLDETALGGLDAVLICVPTPLGRHQEPDLSYIERTGEAIARALKPGQLVVLESTTYPGTTRDVLHPILERSNAKGQYFLAFSPEREDPGRTDMATTQIPKLVGGLDDASTGVAVALYAAAFDRVVRCSSCEVAEAAKILENTYRAVNIALVNELKVLFTAMNIDVWEVIDAARTKPFGFQAFSPGPGLGGHCIPIDPYYLTWKAREVGLPTRFIELAGEINHAMPQYVIERLSHALNQRRQAIKGSRILVLGLAYKPDIDDVRESPSFEIIERLQELGADVSYHDPHVPRTHTMRKHDLKLESVPLNAALLGSVDAVVVATAHSACDWTLVGDHARLIIDTRNALKHYGVGPDGAVDPGKRAHIVMA